MMHNKFPGNLESAQLWIIDPKFPPCMMQADFATGGQKSKKREFYWEPWARE
jgi:hypothetical protein